MHGGSASCAVRHCDSGCCHVRAPASQPPAETTLGGPAAAPPFLLSMPPSDPQTAGRSLPEYRQPSILQALAPPLFLLHASFLN